MEEQLGSRERRWSCLIAKWTTRAILGLHAAAALLIALAPLWGALDRWLMRSTHLSGPSYAAWFASQPIPRMYAYANRLWVSRQPLSAAELGGARPLPPHSVSFYVNHYPIKYGTASGLVRLPFAGPESSLYFYTRSERAGRSASSAFRARPPTERNPAIELRAIAWPSP